MKQVKKSLGFVDFRTQTLQKENVRKEDNFCTKLISFVENYHKWKFTWFLIYSYLSLFTFFSFPAEKEVAFCHEFFSLDRLEQIRS